MAASLLDYACQSECLPFAAFFTALYCHGVSDHCHFVFIVHQIIFSHKMLLYREYAGSSAAGVFYLSARKGNHALHFDLGRLHHGRADDLACEPLFHEIINVKNAAKCERTWKPASRLSTGTLKRSSVFCASAHARPFFRLPM